MEIKNLERRAANIRRGIILATGAAGSGHPGGSLSAADILSVLYFHEMNYNPKDPNMQHRDKFILSKGHGAPLLYATLAESGYFPKEDILTLRKINSKFQGHPDSKSLPGVETCTGSLGQGFSMSIGMALAGRLDKSKGRVYVLLGDGELQEGLVWEAAMAAGHYSLDNMVAIVDWNGLQIDGKNDDVMRVTPIAEKFAAFGWNTLSIDGHNIPEIIEALYEARNMTGKPTVIVAKTIKGKGVSFMENQAGWHGKAPNEEEVKIALAEIGGEWA